MIPVPAARTLAIPADGVAFTGRGLLRGWALHNAEGTNATTVAVYDGGGTGGVPIVTFGAIAGGDNIVFPGQGAIAFERGLFVDRGAESITLVLYFNPETRILTSLGLFDDDTEDITELGIFRLGLSIGAP